MSNWNKYNKTLNYLKENINYYEEELKKYYYTIIFNEKNDNIDQDILKLNPALFTYFNNVPDKFHPLPKKIYYDYICYISYVDPSFVKKKTNNDIIKYKNILHQKYFKQRNIIKQDISPYNYFKRNLSINLKHFNIKKYLKEKYVLLIYTDKNHKYIVNKDSNLDFSGDIVYVNILRKIKPKELCSVFDTEEVKKGTKIYSYHKSGNKQKIYWFGFNEIDILLKDPYQVRYKDGDIIYKYNYEIKKNIKVINLSKNIFLKNKSNLDKLLNKNYSKQKNLIYNGFINYIKYYDDPNKIWNINRGKRLLHEILYKNSSFINLKIYYFNYLEYHNINCLKYTLGYYEKLKKYFPYELGFADNYPSLYKKISVDPVVINWENINK